jgi:DegV family protein with EDD domain
MQWGVSFFLLSVVFAQERLMIRIVTDTLCDLPTEVLKEFNIATMPSYVTIAGKIYRDHIDISPTTFYNHLATTKELPTTTQASVDDYLGLYRQILDETPGATILSIHISEGLSGMLASARQAASLLPDASIKLIDSRLVSLGEGILVHAAARMARDGADLSSILTHLSAMSQSMKSYYILDTLDYLYMGGRIGRAALFFGTLLDMKPILTFQNGAVAPFERHRSRERAIARMEEVIIEAGQAKQHIHLAVAHAACEADANAFAKKLREALDPEVLIIGQIGPAVGTYTGPGSLGAFVWGEPRE